MDDEGRAGARLAAERAVTEPEVQRGCRHHHQVGRPKASPRALVTSCGCPRGTGPRPIPFVTTGMPVSSAKRCAEPRRRRPRRRSRAPARDGGAARAGLRPEPVLPDRAAPGGSPGGGTSRGSGEELSWGRRGTPARGEGCRRRRTRGRPSTGSVDRRHRRGELGHGAEQRRWSSSAGCPCPSVAWGPGRR